MESRGSPTWNRGRRSLKWMLLNYRRLAPDSELLLLESRYNLLWTADGFLCNI